MAAVWRTMTRIRGTIDRRRRRLLLLLPLVPAAALAAYMGGGVGEDDLARGRQLYLDNCASCHGVDLEGQPDWRKPNPDKTYPAPPHDAEGHTWHHTDSMLFRYVKLGGDEALKDIPGVKSAMSGFGETLSDQEIRDLLDYIKSTWPERERQYQADRSLADEEARQ